LPIRPGVPTAMTTFVFFRYSTCSDTLKCFANNWARPQTTQASLAR
jgi:hypothetical protein